MPTSSSRVGGEMREGGVPWLRVLATLRGARGVLLLLTPGFEGSPWCLEQARAVAARLDQARSAAARQSAGLPIFVGKEASWDEGKLPAAFAEFSADSDFAQQRAEEPGLAADMLEHWRKTLRSVAYASHFMHNLEPRRCMFCSSGCIYLFRIPVGPI